MLEDVSLGGIYKSTNEGQTWEYKALGNKTVYSLERDILGDIYCGTALNLFKSYDKGETWEEIFYAVENFNVIKSHPNGYLFAGGAGNSHGVFRSIDFGTSWDTCVVFTNYGTEDMRSIAISEEGHIYIGTHNIFGPSGLYRSTDIGDTWESVESPTQSIFGLGFHPNGKLFVGGLGTGLYRYDASTQNWFHDLYNITPQAFQFIGNDTIMFGCNYSPNFMPGVMISTNGGQNYEWLNSGMGDGTPIEYFEIDDKGYIFGQGSWLFRSTEQIVTNLGEHYDHRSLLVSNYPNPFSENTIIKWPFNPEDEFIQFNIFNSSGQHVKESKIKNSGEVLLNGHSFPPGIYYIQITDSHKYFTGKMVKVN
ncbi:MAG TPA: T9SS type A sorting domain-containing protein [Bacteroidales bacterium]|nr:T9SS type A sorting domain-containing protein [Bacteroidales bacterium]HRX97514.1 T9SS type A sorting domain-containing protein [Bacteroidales bacterium]